MAKLTGVKPIDMVNGDVYERVGTDSPQVGDIIEMTTGDFWGEFIKGDQFEVKGESEEPSRLYIIDNNGDRRYILKYEHLKFKVVKAAEEAPAEELFAKVNRPDNEPIVGDFVEFDLSDYGKSYFKVGKKYEVDEDKDVMDEEGDYRSVYNTYRPIKNIYVKYTQEQADQVAEVGDKILIVDEAVITHGYSNGDVVEVTEDFGNGDVKGDGTCIILPGEYTVLTDAQAGGQGEQSEEVAEKAAEASAPYSDLEVGDRVMVVIAKGQEPRHGWGSYVNNNDIGTVVEIGATPLYDDDKMVAVDFPDREGWYAKQSELIKVAENDDFLPGTVVKGDLSEEIYTIGERRLDKDGVFGKAYYVEGEGNVWVGDKQFEVLPKCEALRKLRIKTAVAEAVEDYKEEAAEKLSVGDYAKVVDGGNFDHGDIVKILRESISSDYVICSLVSAGEPDGDVNFGDIQAKRWSDLVPASDEEVAEAKRQFEGSKIEEPAEVPEETIEAGDLVKVINSPFALPNGSYFIAKIDADGRVRSVVDGGSCLGEGYKYSPINGNHLEIIAKAADVYV